MVSELVVNIKDEEKNLKKKFLIYDEYKADENDPLIQKYIQETLSNFDGEPTSVKIVISMEVQ